MNSISKTAAPSKAGCLLELFFWEGGGIFFLRKGQTATILKGDHVIHQKPLFLF